MINFGKIKFVCDCRHHMLSVCKITLVKLSADVCLTVIICGCGRSSSGIHTMNAGQSWSRSRLSRKHNILSTVHLSWNTHIFFYLKKIYVFHLYLPYVQRIHSIYTYLLLQINGVCSKQIVEVCLKYDLENYLFLSGHDKIIKEPSNSKF